MLSTPIYSEQNDLTVGFPHSEIYGSKVAHTSPQLIAACHVLHRLCMPRHPPNALKTLDRSHYHHPPIAVQHMTDLMVMRSVDRQIAPSCETTVLKINYFIQINPTDTGGCMCYTPLAEGD